MNLGIVVCEEPEILQLMILAKNLLTLIQVFVPIGLIIFISTDVLKAVTAANQDDIMRKVRKIPNRLLLAGIAFFIPVIINLTVSLVDNTFEYANCFSNANTAYINEAYKSKAEKLLIEAENVVEASYVAEALTAINKINEPELKNAMLERAKAVAEQVDQKNADYLLARSDGPITSLKNVEDDTSSTGGSSSGTGIAEFDGYYTDGKGIIATPGGTNVNEPNPAAAINYWIKNNDLYKEGDFFYPKASNGLSLGAWPKNYINYPTQLTNYKTYNGGVFIFPNTPYKNEIRSNEGIYNYVYEHNGIDIIAPIGTPVYSPVDGELAYSIWGGTRNIGTTETSYTVAINMAVDTYVNDIKVGAIYMTHFSGITNRCELGECNKKIKKGELIGFTGWANAGHLHMTIHPKGNYDGGLMTKNIESLYNIPYQSSSFNIRAGG